MKYLIFSDIHGNLPALEKVLKYEKNIDGYINLGDVVNYGPWSNECVEVINDLKNCINIKGNHEEYFISGTCNVNNEIVQAFFETNYPKFRMHKSIIKYKKSDELFGYVIKHNLNEKGYIFYDTKVNLIRNTIIGHSHQQYLRNINKKVLLNPGSLGQNRSKINLSNYVVWDIKKNEFDLKSLEFDVKILIQQMKSNNFPEICINYYIKKV